MKRTRFSTVVILVLLGALISWFVDSALTSAGQQIIAIPVTLPPVLAAIGGIVVVLAVPILQATRGKRKKLIDHLYATRVVMLAKASALTGALLSGAAIGICLYLLTRLVVPGFASFGLALATLVGAAILLTAGLVAEWFCTIPPAGDDEDTADKHPASIEP